MTTRINYTRAAALLWWKNLSLSHKKSVAEQWQNSLIERDTRKEWPFELVYYSDSTIEQIYSYLN